MRISNFTSLLIATLFVAHGVVSQLSGSVGPTTSTAAKKGKKTCNVLDYGAKADQQTDLSSALSKAWSACASGGLGKTRLAQCYKDEYED
jgi:rhamnogalacturonan hydrolase